MRIRLTSLVLVFLLSGGAFAGVPVPFGEQSCDMDHASGNKDCHAAALIPTIDAQMATARLCCVLNCSKEGTAPTNVVRFAPQLQVRLIPYPTIPQAVMTSAFKNRLFGSSHGPPGDSYPAYIRNLALLI